MIMVCSTMQDILTATRNLSATYNHSPYKLVTTVQLYTVINTPHDLSSTLYDRLEPYCNQVLDCNKAFPNRKESSLRLHTSRGPVYNLWSTHIYPSLGAYISLRSTITYPL